MMDEEFKAELARRTEACRGDPVYVRASRRLDTALEEMRLDEGYSLQQLGLAIAATLTAQQRLGYSPQVEAVAMAILDMAGIGRSFINERAAGMGYRNPAEASQSTH